MDFLLLAAVRLGFTNQQAFCLFDLLFYISVNSHGDVEAVS